MHVKRYNKTCILQLSICRVQIKNKNKQLTCKIFVVPRNDTVLLSMPDIKLLHVLRIRCTTIDGQQGSGEVNNHQSVEEN